MSQTSTRLLLLVCVSIWGSTFIATKVCLAYLSPSELVGARFLIGLPILAGIYLYLEPVATTHVAVPVLGESFGIVTILGGVSVLAGVWWAEA